MKSLSILLVLVLRITTLFADDNAAISNVYIHQSGKNNLFVLQLKDGDTYDYMRYTDKHTYHDYGVYTIRHGKISFVSKNRTHGFNSVGGKTYFLNKKGLFKTRMDAWRGKKSTLEISEDPIYMHTWDFNPITGKSAADVEAEKTKLAEDKKAKAGEAHLKQMAAFTKTFYMNEAMTYANPYTALLETNYCGPEACVTTIDGVVVPYSGDTTKTTLVSKYATVIHESTHNFNSHGSYLVMPGVEIPVSHTRTFYSSEIKSIVPAGASDKIFRYNDYVGVGSELSANTTGIYGLMDEFSAYENGTRACVLSAQSALQYGDTALAKNFLSQASENYFAAYEFELFIGWYLHYAKDNQQEIYKGIMANDNLRIAYTLTDQQFISTIADMKKTATTAKAGKDYFSYYETTYAAYPKQLLAKEKPYLSAFMMKGVTENNYSDFIKKSNTTAVKGRG
jgi:hypothetical protein